MASTHHNRRIHQTERDRLWQGVLGMSFIFEQPNLGKPDENHLYFDPGDGRLLTVFTDESRRDAGRKAPREPGCVEHLAFNVSRATFALAPVISNLSSATAASWTPSTCTIPTASRSNSPATNSRPPRASARRTCW